MTQEVVHVDHFEATRLLRNGLPSPEAKARHSASELNLRGSKGPSQRHPACPAATERDANARLKS